MMCASDELHVRSMMQEVANTATKLFGAAPGSAALSRALAASHACISSSLQMRFASADPKLKQTELLSPPS